MKKKIFFAFLLLGLFMNISFAQEELNQTDETVLNLGSQMPTDEEIMSIVEKYSPNSAQNDYLFKETKKSIEKLYQQQQEQSKQNSAIKVHPKFKVQKEIH